MTQRIHPVAELFLAAKGSGGRRVQTIEGYRKHFRAMARHFGEDGLPAAPHELEAWLAQCRAAATVNGRLSAARALLRWAHRRGHLAERPTWLEDVERPTRRRAPIRIFTQGELAAIAREAAEDPIDFALFCVLLDTGVRIGEAASIRPQGIRPNELDVIDGKTGPRVVPMTAPTRKALLAIAGTNRIWPGRRGMAMTDNGLEWRCRRLLQRSGIQPPKAGAHTFRHTFATAYLAKGGDIKRLSQILGHKSVKTTEVYLHMDTSYLHQGFSALSPLADALAPARMLPWGAEKVS